MPSWNWRIIVINLPNVDMIFQKSSQLIVLNTFVRLTEVFKGHCSALDTSVVSLFLQKSCRQCPFCLEATLAFWEVSIFQKFNKAVKYNSGKDIFSDGQKWKSLWLSQDLRLPLFLHDVHGWHPWRLKVEAEWLRDWWTKVCSGQRQRALPICQGSWPFSNKG